MKKPSRKNSEQIGVNSEQKLQIQKHKIPLLAQGLQDWIVLTESNDLDVSTEPWTLDLFWIAFVAAHPRFPRGSWPRWDERVPMAGSFMTKWMGGSKSGLCADHSTDGEFQDCTAEASETRTLSLHHRLWAEFSDIVSLHLPHAALKGSLSNVFI